MDAGSGGGNDIASPPSTTIQFSDLYSTAAGPSSDDHKPVMNEMNFFGRDVVVDVDEQSTFTTDDASNGVQSNIHTGLHLDVLTQNTIDGEPIRDDEMSLNSEDKRNKKLEVELEKMSFENQKLKEVIHQMSIKLQKQEEITPSDQGSGDVMLVPRPFMDLGLAALEDENSRSSSEGLMTKTHAEIARLPINNINGRDLREEIHEQVLACSNKKPRLKNEESSSIDQATEATIRKARVSVRARSESNMIEGRGHQL